MLRVQEGVLLLLQLLFQLFLVLSLLLQLFLGLFQFLALLLGYLDGLRACNHFLLHLLQPIEQLHLLRLRLFFVVLALLDLLENSILLLLGEIRLVFDGLRLLLGFAGDF